MGLHADVGDLVMERHVALDELLQVDHRVAVCGNGLEQARDLLVGGGFGGHAGGAGFQENAGFLHMPEHLRLGTQEMLGTGRHLIDQAGRPW